jgi:hypothetical protein
MTIQNRWPKKELLRLHRRIARGDLSNIDIFNSLKQAGFAGRGGQVDWLAWEEYRRNNFNSVTEDVEVDKDDSSQRHDLELCLMLQAKIIQATAAVKGFVYFKKWCLPAGEAWYKVGITNNLKRRDGEQNVLPVPPVSIATVAVASMEHARAIECAIHLVLNEWKIEGAQNRELFKLSIEQEESVRLAIINIS